VHASGVYEAVAPYRWRYVLQVTRFCSELLTELQHIAQAAGNDEIPYFSKLLHLRAMSMYTWSRKARDTE
jgi:hypothetical protein